MSPDGGQCPPGMAFEKEGEENDGKNVAEKAIYLQLPIHEAIYRGYNSIYN